MKWDVLALLLMYQLHNNQSLLAPTQTPRTNLPKILQTTVPDSLFQGRPLPLLQILTLIIGKLLLSQISHAGQDISSIGTNASPALMEAIGMVMDASGG